VFRVAQYGLRQVFPARAGPSTAGRGARPENLRDWRGEATAPAAAAEVCQQRPRRGPIVRWCDIEVPHVWRCGNRGSVASVLIEKPARGDFLPILDGGYSLQYSPLMEYGKARGCCCSAKWT